jgi:lathosterol oxidase
VLTVLPAAAIALAEWFVATYAVLLACFVGTAIIVGRVDRARPHAKIQKDRATPQRQARRDLRQSLLSLATIAFFFALGSVLYERFGVGFRADGMGVVGMALSFVASMVLYDTWFYWLHRLLHQAPFYRAAHRWHHLTTTPVAWSNNSDTFLDNCVLQSYWIVAHLLLPVGPLVLLAHKAYDQITGTIGHSGHEHGGPLCLPPSPLVSVTHHDQHHRHFRCNYATHFIWWDRAMGTLHRDYAVEARRNIRAAGAAAGCR